MKYIENIRYCTGTHPRQVLDVYLPESDIFPVFVYFHGGGIERGDKCKKPFFNDLLNRGIAIVSANYRLYPDAVYPEFLRDAAAAVAWAMNHMGEYGTVTGLFVGGSSAGGYLTQMLCFDRKYLAAHKLDSDAIDGYIMDAGQPTVHFNVLRERGEDSRRVVVDEAAPLWHICAERTYAPMQIIVSDNDMENRYEQTMLLVSTLRHFRHDMSRVDVRVMQNSTHCAYLYSRPDGVNVFAELVAEFIATYTKQEKQA